LKLIQTARIQVTKGGCPSVIVVANCCFAASG